MFQPLLQVFNLSVFCLLLCAQTRLEVELHLTFLACPPDLFFTRLKLACPRAGKATAMENGLSETHNTARMGGGGGAHTPKPWP